MDKKIEKLIRLFEQAGLNLLSLIRTLENGPTRRVKEQLFRQIDGMINQLISQSSEITADILTEQYRSGSAEAIQNMIAQGLSESSINASLQSVIHTRAVQAIMDEAFYSILEATDHMSTDAKNRITEVVKRANERSLVEGLSRRKATRDAIDELANQGITGMVNRNGARIPAEKYMAGTIQYHQRKAHVEGALNRINENGYDLVYVNYVGITCDLCATYQGRVYSISGNDPRFPKLERKPPYHSHCVHSLSAWLEEYKDSDEISEMRSNSNQPFKDTRSQRQIDTYEQRQRERSRKNETRKQWIRYKARMPDLPDLKTFASHKARDTEKYREWMATFREIGIEIKGRGE